MQLTSATAPIQLMVTLPGGLKFGGSYTSSIEDKLTAEFKTVIEGREGLRSPARPKPGRQTHNAGGASEAEVQTAKRRVRPSQLPVMLEVPSIDVTMLHKVEEGSAQVKQPCCITATIGLAVGFGDSATLAIELFPVYVKVDLDRLAALQPMVVPSATDPIQYAGPSESSTPPTLNQIRKMLALMARSSTLTCEGGVLELLSSKSQQSMLVVSENIHIEIEGFIDDNVDVLLARCRNHVRALAVTCIGKSQRPSKVISVKSIALNAQLMRHNKLSMRERENGCDVTVALSAALSETQIALNDQPDGLLSWAARFQRRDTHGKPPPPTTNAFIPCIGGIPLHKVEFEAADTTIDVAVDKHDLSVGCDGDTTVATFSTALIGVHADFGVSDMSSRKMHGEVSNMNLELHVRNKLNDSLQKSFTKQALGTIGRVTTEVEQKLESSGTVATVVAVIIVKSELLLSLESILSFSHIVNVMRLFYLKRLHQGRRPAPTALHGAFHPFTAELKIVDACCTLCDSGLNPDFAANVESLSAGVRIQPVESDRAKLAPVLSFEGSVSQFRILDMAKIEGKGMAKRNQPTAVKIVALEFACRKDNPAVAEIQLCVPEIEIRNHIHRLKKVFDITNQITDLAKQIRALAAEQQTSLDEHSNSSQVPLDIHFKVDLAVVRLLFKCPATSTTRVFQRPHDPKESCAACDYSLRVLQFSLESSSQMSQTSVTFVSAAGNIGGVQALIISGGAIELLSGGPLLDELRLQCASHTDHAASPERMHDDGEQGIGDRPTKSKAYWFYDVQSVSTKLWCISFDTIEVLHPHDFNMGLYVDHLQNTVFAVRKLFRESRGTLKPSSLGNSAAATNVMLKFGLFKFSVEDDPFESRLYFGHRLRSEEYDEQQVRRLLLNQRVDKLRDIAATQGQDLDPQWVKSLNAAFLEENSNIYCKRFSKLRPACDTALLFDLEFRDFQLGLIVDDRLTGSEDQLKNTVQLLDPAAEIPEQAKPEFTFARRLFLSVKAVEVGVRRFARKPLVLQDLVMTGALIMRSMWPWDDVHQQLARSVKVADGLVQIERNGMPLHIYHGLRLTSSKIEYAWGSSYDPALQQVATKLGLIVDRGVTTSPIRDVAVTWFDRIRQLRHGPIELTSKCISIAVMSGQNPNVDENFVELELSNASIAWSDGAASFACDLNTRLFPKNRFYGSPFLSVSGLRGTVRTMWTCCGGEKYKSMHHEPRLEHFCSKGVDIAIMIDRVASDGICACVLYTDTLIWINRVYEDLFCVSRPRIKRGPLWQAFKPPKLNTLGQHISIATISLELIDSKLMYYDDMDRKYGVRLNTAHLLYETSYKQVLIQKAEGMRGGTFREWLYASEIWEMAAVEATAVSRLPPGSITGRFTPVTDETECDSGSDGDEDNAEWMECMHKGLDVLAAGEDDTIYKSEALFEATFIQYTRGFQFDRRLKRRGGTDADRERVKSNARDTSSPGGVTRERRGSDLRERTSSSASALDCSSDSAMHDVFVRDFNLVYGLFTADIIWAVYNAYAEHYSLHFDLSPNALNTDGSKTQGMRKRRTSDGKRHSGTPDMLGQLIADAGSNFVASGKVGRLSNFGGTDGEGQGDAVLRKIYSDVIQMYMTLRFSRPQIFFRGLNGTLPIVQVAETMVVDVRNHTLVQKQGRLCCKDSWSVDFKNAQYFSVKAPDMSRPTWIPYECIEFHSGEREPVPDYLRCLSPASDLTYITIFHFFDGTVAKNYTPSALMSMRHKSHSQLGDTFDWFDEMQDVYLYRMDRLVLDVDAKSWEGIQDALGNLVLVASDEILQTQYEIEAILFRSQITKNTDGSDDVLESMRNEIMELQLTVQELKRAQDQNEQLLVSLERQTARTGTNAEHEIVFASLHDELARNKRLFLHARHSLRIRVTALNEYILNPVRESSANGNKARKWNARYDVQFGQGQLTFVDNDDKPICEVRMDKISYIWKWHNTGFGEQIIEVGDLVVVDMQSPCAEAGKGPPAVLEVYHELLGTTSQSRTALRVYMRDGISVGGIPVSEHFEANLLPLQINVKQTLVDALMMFLFPPEVAPDAAIKGVEPHADTKVRRSRRGSISNDLQVEMPGEGTLASVPVPPPRRKPKRRGTISASMQAVSSDVTDEIQGKELDTGDGNVNTLKVSPAKTHKRSRSGGGDLATQFNSMEILTQEKSTAVHLGVPNSDSVSVNSRKNSHQRAKSFTGKLSDLTQGEPASAIPRSMTHHRTSSNTSDEDVVKALQGAQEAEKKTTPVLKRRGSITRLINKSRETSMQHTAEAQVATMRSRSQKHRTYVCFKVTRFTICVSYRRKEGDKTTMLDLNNVVVKLPLIEYHNRTFTNEALVNQLKADCFGHIVSAFLKRKVLGVNTAEKKETKAQEMAALAEGGSDVKEHLLFGSDKAKIKMEKKHEKAVKKQEKRDERARKKLDKNEADRPEGVSGRSRLWSASTKKK